MLLAIDTNWFPEAYLEGSSLPLFTVAGRGLGVAMWLVGLYRGSQKVTAVLSTQEVAAKLGTLKAIGDEDMRGSSIFKHIEMCHVLSKLTGMHNFCHKVTWKGLWQAIVWHPGVGCWKKGIRGIREPGFVNLLGKGVWYLLRG